jgi:TusA-related sulfurtransferase
METHIAFVDLEKAFDRVNKTKILEILQDDSIPQQIIQNIYNLFKTNLISVKIEDRKSEWKVIDSGVRKGCRLPPILFIIYMNVIITQTEETETT